MIRKNFMKTCILLSIVLLTLNTNNLIINTDANPTATVYVDPPEITGLTVGENFAVNVSIADVSDLAGWEFRLYFLSRILYVINVQEGPFLKNVRGTIFVEANITNHYNSTHGLVYLACALLGSGHGADGSGTLATINFNIVGVGETPLSLPPNETKLLDSTPTPPGPQPIPHITRNGLVRVGGNDVAVIDINLYKNFANDTVIPINVTVQNYGNFSATFDVTLYYNENEIETQTVTDLSPDEVQTLTFTWNTTPVPKGNYTIKAYAHPVTGETILDNNLLIGGCIIETILGDVTGDYKVDIRDISQIARAYDSSVGDPRWNPNADLNNDKKINIVDVSMAARNYGKEI